MCLDSRELLFGLGLMLGLVCLGYLRHPLLNTRDFVNIERAASSEFLEKSKMHSMPFHEIIVRIDREPPRAENQGQ